jgi:hypothetical protein
VAAAALALLAMPGCAAQDRPEGVVERWLISLNQGAAGDPDRFAPDDVSQQVLPGWEECEPNALDVIEVGGGRVERGPGGVQTAGVPYRVEYASDLPDLCESSRRPDLSEQGTVVLSRFRGSDAWRVERLDPLDPTLRVPSEGGGRIGSATAVHWLLGLLAAVALIVLVTIVMSTQPPARPIPSDLAREPDARGM